MRFLFAATIFLATHEAFAKLSQTQIQAVQSAGSVELDTKDPDEVNKALIEVKHVTGRPATVSQKVFSQDGVGHYTIRVEN